MNYKESTLYISISLMLSLLISKAPVYLFIAILSCAVLYIIYIIIITYKKSSECILLFISYGFSAIMLIVIKILDIFIFEEALTQNYSIYRQIVLIIIFVFPIIMTLQYLFKKRIIQNIKNKLDE